MHILQNETVSPKTGVLYLKNVTITRMVWSVDSHVVTVATGNRVMTWTEVVCSDVTMVFMARIATLVVQFLYQMLPSVLLIIVNRILIHSAEIFKNPKI